MKTIEERFWTKVDMSGDGCWPWLGAISNGKYGRFNIGGSIYNAHRVAWELTNGGIPEGEGFHGTCVCHTCDNGLCCNPAHLFLGTHQENMQDRETKGRTVTTFPTPGESHAMAKLGEEDIHEIRETYAAGGVTQRCLADLFGVSAGLINGIVNRKLWRHV